MATANLNDMAILATDSVFGSRVFAALIQFCTTVVPSETITSTTVQLHVARKNYAAQVLNNPNQYKPLFINAVSSNSIVANEATAAGTLAGMTGQQIATAALLCLDTDINNAVAAAFNAFISGI
jgi:hypothetical protein